MLKAPFSKTVDHFVDSVTDHPRRRNLHPVGHESVNAYVLYLIMSVPASLVCVDPITARTYWDVNLLNVSSTMSHCPSFPRMWFRARVFSAGTSYCGGVNQLLDGTSRPEEPGTDLVRKPVDGLWRRSGDFEIRERGNFCASRPAIFSGPKRCELYHARVEIHQKRLEPAMPSTKRW